MAANNVDTNKLSEFVEKQWKDSVIPSLEEFIAIPNQSPFFDAEWETNGHMDKAVEHCVNWAKALGVAGMDLKVVKGDKGRTPVIFAQIEASKGAESRGTVLLYSHLDKQPPLDSVDGGWEDGLGPYKPVIKDGKLYGRGGADDGYGMYAALVAIKGLQEQGVPHGRLILLTEACEESGSADLPYYLDLLEKEIGEPALIVCLDSGCGNYEQLWMTTSLRGAVVGTLRVKVLNEGVHSGLASGIVPDSFRIIRMLLNRLEDANTGVVVKQFHTDIPPIRLKQAQDAAAVLGDEIHTTFPWPSDKSKPFEGSNTELLLNRTWRPALSYVGIAGIPHVSAAGNVLRSETQLTLSLRLPPNGDADKAKAELKRLLESDPPYGAEVEFTAGKAGSGFDAPLMPEWLDNAVTSASEAFWGKPPLREAGGGSIPFMGLLKKKFPKASFAVTGVLGPKSNAHGPNEFLHIQMSANIAKSVALFIDAVPSE
mmetsp:Transcript_6106/g.9523  ORF Transcript_6106/g.9523 Transcript_6106/m.9523 type:complete len:483 (+) Transcript_6106:21-1469(+)|eukprot:CAMPEP_0201560378 /NCGR_PEP_ID=MMETSP0173_2-20130828/78237_1 /ASSEMBLY_ACC=CAM_ASM_000268 /TAXON_ID=218659 /ORGANISM="Vexillifera sp., Strain DIVA3 564/2" /LENGTH=482 /DNA_ID=CAMNT_0047974825 /DNA_START=21 /DNA_END=1469 /DNA_ORIENTATION=-